MYRPMYPCSFLVAPTRVVMLVTREPPPSPAEVSRPIDQDYKGRYKMYCIWIFIILIDLEMKLLKTEIFALSSALVIFRNLKRST
jgi:hypothetical protein